MRLLMRHVKAAHWLRFSMLVYFLYLTVGPRDLCDSAYQTSYHTTRLLLHLAWRQCRHLVLASVRCSDDRSRNKSTTNVEGNCFVLVWKLVSRFRLEGLTEPTGVWIDRISGQIFKPGLTKKKKWRNKLSNRLRNTSGYGIKFIFSFYYFCALIPFYFQSVLVHAANCANNV
jgi:hypothetical protein